MLTSGRPLREIANEVYAYLSDQLARGESDFPRLASLDECICIKNDQGVVVYGNSAYRRMFAPDASPVGRTGDAFLTPMLAERTNAFVRLILDGCKFVECEHSGPGPDGSIYHIHAYKRSLRALNAPGLAILAVHRVIGKEEGTATASQIDLAVSSSKFRELSDRDQEICRLTALGISSRELGERLGMTTRGIELRKQKAFAHLGVAKAVDLARLLTRLQDRGYLDLGL